MQRFNTPAQVFLRLALAVCYLSAVADRLGWWGPPGAPGVLWGGWQHFCDYTHKLLFFVPRGLSDVGGLLATVAEVVLGGMLIVGFKIRWAAIGSGLLALSFMLSMILALGVHAPLNYQVPTVCAASFLLAVQARFGWSVDALKRTT